MLSNIIEKEQALHELLPTDRPQDSQGQEQLLAAKEWSEWVWSEAERLGPMIISAAQQSKGLSLVEYPVFICGVHRSGTTLVRDLLDDHPDLLTLPSEGTYFTNLENTLNQLLPGERLAFLAKEWLRRLANPINQAPYWILGRTDEKESPYLLFARYSMGWWEILSRSGHRSWPHLAIVLGYASCTGNLQAKMWVDKTPNNEFFLQRIWQEMPQAKIIYLMRDPKAILSSRKKLEPGCSPLQVLREMERSLSIARKAMEAHDNRFLIVRYEELTSSPSDLIQELRSFLHIGASISLHTPTVAGSPTRANSSFTKRADAGKIFSSYQHHGNQNLSNEDMQTLSAFVGKLAKYFQYPIGEMSAWKSHYWKFWARWNQLSFKR